MSQTPRFFLDSADPTAWQSLVDTGWVHGITTNPLVLKQAGLPTSLATARMLLAAVEEQPLKELQFQVWGETTAEFVSRGRQLAALSPVMTIKIPATVAGFAAAFQLKQDDARITLTACYTVAQCALANAMGLDYVAPYYGRMLEASIDADARLDGMRRVNSEKPHLRILIASLRSGAQVDALLSRGFDTFTLRPALAQALMIDDASTRAAVEFEAAARAEPVVPPDAAEP